MRVAMRGLCHRYGAVLALDHLDLEVADGEILAVLGPSGSGKTTLLQLLAGLLEPSAGEVWIGDRIVSRPGRVEPPERRHIGMVFQDFALWPHLTVAETIAFPLRCRKVPPPRWPDRIRQLLALVRLPGMERRYPHELSGGQRQRVAIARALATHPALVLLDEPMSSLDAVLREEMRAELAAILHHEGVTAVYVTHDRSEALSVADRVAVLRDGRLVQTGTPQECYDRPTTPFVATFLGPAHLIPAQVTALHHDVGGRLLHLATPLGGPVPARGPEGVSAGQTGQWLLRPEQLVLEPPKMLPALTWQAVVTRSTYQGGCWKVQLQSATGLAITTVARRPLSQGEALTVFALADEPWFVPDHGAVRAPVPA